MKSLIMTNWYKCSDFREHETELKIRSLQVLRITLDSGSSDLKLN
jgi:hypothetical protein